MFSDISLTIDRRMYEKETAPIYIVTMYYIIFWEFVLEIIWKAILDGG